jgi:hypothetical protein
MSGRAAQPEPTPYPPNAAREPGVPAVDHVHPKAKTEKTSSLRKRRAHTARLEGGTPTIKRRKREAEAKAFGPPTPLAVPAGPLVTYDANGIAMGCTAAGLELVRKASAEGFAQVSIAASLGVSLKVFERLLGRADAEPMSDVRAAWELGQGDLRSELVRLCLAGARRGGMGQSLFLLKSLFQFRDQGPAITVENSNRINFLLPGPMSEQEYFAKLGIKEAVDTRPESVRGLSPAAQMGLPQIEVSDSHNTGGDQNA